VNRLIALLDGRPQSPAVAAMARIFAQHLETTALALHAGRPDRAAATAAREAAASAGLALEIVPDHEALHHRLEGQDVVMVVMGCRNATDPGRPIGALAIELLERLSAPVTVVVPDCRLPLSGIQRVLLPLDGTAGSSAAAARALRLLHLEGTDVLALHVVSAESVPPFVDQPQHGYAQFAESFREANCAASVSELAICHGDVGDAVVLSAESEQVDLIVMGWAQELQAGRAEVVRMVLRAGGPPVVLLPEGSAGPHVAAERGRVVLR
jgi:nucleotide-binding universal stress UspA family protein